MPKTSWNIPLDLTIPDSKRWGLITWLGVHIRVYVQAKTSDGFWVQLDSDGPFRFVDSVSY